MANLLDLLDQQIVTKDGRATAYFEELFYQVISALGGEGAPDVTDTTNKTVIYTGASLTVDDTYVHSISSAYRTIGNEFIQVTAACTITLNSSPGFGEKVTIQPTGNFTVTVSGTINGESSIIMRGAYDVMDLVYTELGWSIV